MMPSRLTGLFVLGFAFWFAVGCQAPQQGTVPLPRYPQETFDAKFVYPPDPVIISFAQFRQSLDQLSEQLTVLYVDSPDRPYRQEQIDCLVDIQRDFYCYGVLVLMLSRDSPEHWPELRATLETRSGNFPAAYIPPDQWELLKKYLNASPESDYQIWIVDDRRNIIIGIDRPTPCPRFRQRISGILHERTAGATQKID